MKKKRVCISVGIILIFLVMWFSKFLPKQVVRVVAINYMSQQEDGDMFKLKRVDYSSAYGAYFACFENKENLNEKVRNIGIYYKWFPCWVYFDSQKPLF